MPAWKPIPPEELLQMEAGEPVVTYTIEWKNGKRLEHFQEGTFQSYSEHRGIVAVHFIEGFSIEHDFCEGSVGRYGIPEPWQVHTALGGYDDE
jgi:hypothetical protein